MINVVSFSGGRTSAFLVRTMLELDPETQFIFMDTGAEHPKTYDFIREVVQNWQINLTCLRLVPNNELGRANSYEVVDVADIQHDMTPWVRMMKKYGLPYVTGPFCTDRMKLGPFQKYCNEKFGKGNYTTWLGMRADEPARIWGQEILSVLRRMKMDDFEIRSLYQELSEKGNQQLMVEHLSDRYLLDTVNARRISDRIMKMRSLNQRFLAEVSDFDKEDILNWWAKQPFNLQLEEHLGNCVFCIKKSLSKIALAMRDAPELLAQFNAAIRSEEVRELSNRQSAISSMYRNSHSLETIESLFSHMSREDIATTIKGNKAYDTGSCSESCEAFIADSTQMDLFNQEEAA
ncbi:phosphoadenosine phosphosulfate reductase family protein [Chimaeribacter californicus]|uniref:phosphoadenosine phosphosulfate reductase domain-containing protein n=1 Tax=Chimaeribacter californicus TaxID=2060067 RepID=UPI0019D49B26|nr:phosphoadenosine phosphosulfate reductase family protein [Chimaeribacter californicus]